MQPPHQSDRSLLQWAEKAGQGIGAKASCAIHLSVPALRESGQEQGSRKRRRVEAPGRLRGLAVPVRTHCTALVYIGPVLTQGMGHGSAGT